MRNLGVVLDHEESPCPVPHAIHAVASQDHQRGVALRRRDGRGTVRLRSSTAPRGRAGDLRRGMLAGIANLFQRGELFAG